MTAADLIYLFQEAAEADRIERKARDGYEGGSWGYHGASLIEAREKSEDRLQKALERFVDERIDLKMAKECAYPKGQNDRL